MEGSFLQGSDSGTSSPPWGEKPPGQARCAEVGLRQVPGGAALSYQVDEAEAGSPAGCVSGTEAAAAAALLAAVLAADPDDGEDERADEEVEDEEGGLLGSVPALPGAAAARRVGVLQLRMQVRRRRALSP